MRAEAGRLRAVLLAGSILGAALGIGLALFMDSLYAAALQGSWRDAIVHDLNSFFSLGVTKGSPVVTAVFLVVLAILGAFGGFLGFIFTFFIYKFFAFLKGS
jgi:hypothetical protein